VLSNVDWPLAIMLAVVFVVMSVVRWRYFRSVARRASRRAPTDTTSD
jgi:membrane protein implicated in regulation of membrane protease activity